MSSRWRRLFLPKKYVWLLCNGTAHKQRLYEDEQGHMYVEYGFQYLLLNADGTTGHEYITWKPFSRF